MTSPKGKKNSDFTERTGERVEAGKGGGRVEAALRATRVPAAAAWLPTEPHRAPLQVPLLQRHQDVGHRR